MPVVNGLAPVEPVQQALAAAGADVTALTGQLRAQPPVSPITLQSLKSKLPVGGKNADAATVSDFTPNSQKSKTFRQRLEMGTDFQFGKSENFLPTTATMGLTLGYKLSDKNSAGVGVNYLLGLGNGWKHIRLSNQGLGFRSYVKWKFKGNLFFQAGGEWTYMFQFNSIEELKQARNWQQATLIGLSKTYSINRKVKGNIQLLYNLLHNQNQPRTNPLVIRFGYGF